MRKRKLHRCNVVWKIICVAIGIALVIMLTNNISKLRNVFAAGQDKGYIYIEQTEDANVIRYTEEIGAEYGICPELLQAMVFYESSNNPKAKNSGGDTGYMQINKKWHKDRMNRLGVQDLTDGYGNILVGADYLAELAKEYEDIPLVLMKYNGDSKADKLYRQGEMSDYAKKILDLSQELERLHGK